MIILIILQSPNKVIANTLYILGSGKNQVQKDNTALKRSLHSSELIYFLIFTCHLNINRCFVYNSNCPLEPESGHI